MNKPIESWSIGKLIEWVIIPICLVRELAQIKIAKNYYTRQSKSPISSAITLLDANQFDQTMFLTMPSSSLARLPPWLLWLFLQSLLISISPDDDAPEKRQLFKFPFISNCAATDAP